MDERNVYLQVAMHDSQSVAVLHGVHHRPNRIRGFLLGVVFFVDDAIEKFASGHVL